MKFKILALLVVVFLFGFKGKQKNINSHNRFEWHVVSRKDSVLYISTTLFNNSNESFTYITMTCDSDCIYAIDSKCWVLPQVVCQYNAPIRMTIEPYDKFVSTFKVKVNPKYKATDKHLRIGFKVFRSDIHAMSEKPDTIIWGDKLNVPN